MLLEIYYEIISKTFLRKHFAANFLTILAWNLFNVCFMVCLKLFIESFYQYLNE